MPKILFTADLHIKIGQENVPIEWVENRFNEFINQLSIMQDKADLLILGGDIFDRVPSGKYGVREISLYYDLIHSCKIPTIIYSGNHEALTKNSTFLSNLSVSSSRLNPKVTILDECYSNNEYGIDVIPYNKLKQDIVKNSSNNILCTHVRGEIPPHVKPEIDLDVFKSWEIVLAGDLHNYDNCQRNILYPGSPYTTSFHRSLVKTGAILLDTDTLKHEWLEFSLPQLIRKTVKSSEPMPLHEYHHVIYEVEGNISDLSSITDKSITKKLIKQVKEDSLIFTNSMKKEDELKDYLLYILNCTEEQASELVAEYTSINPEASI